MYVPYFRTHQHELEALRKTILSLRDSHIIPILEPVKSSNLLARTIKDFKVHNVPFVLVVNPMCGHLDEHELLLVVRLANNCASCILGYIVDENTDIQTVAAFLNNHSANKVAIIHFGAFANVAALTTSCQKYTGTLYQIFIESPHVSILYMNKFTMFNRVRIKDGFNPDDFINATFPPLTSFSKLLFRYKEQGFCGFGDFSIVGDKRDEPGFSPRAVAIHIIHLSSTNSGQLDVSHYVSDDKEGIENTGGKFLQALTKMSKSTRNSEFIMQTEALQGYYKLEKEKRFPNLGNVKQLSMRHHLELMASLLPK